MKYIFALSLLFSLKSFADGGRLFFNRNGFVTCYEEAGKSYVFTWDDIIETPQKPVSYFNLSDYVEHTSQQIKNCSQIKYITEIPSEILKSILEIPVQLPEQVLFSIKQIEQGGRVFRTEKTAAEYIAKRKSIFQPDRPEVLSKLRAEAGDTFASEVIAYFTKYITVRNRSCESLIGTCDFYLCQEQKNPCGLDGYNLSFGYKYCSGSKFKLLGQMKTSLGKSWVSDVFQCLQRRSLEIAGQPDTSEISCSKIKKESFDSHPDCYVQAGFCHLKGTEKKYIFGLIKKEILSFQTIVQGAEIIKQCAEDEK